MGHLDDILRFADLLNRFREVERMLFVNGQSRKENDVEHSYQLALLAWYIVDSCNLDFDENLVIKYALVHDLVEVYSGDTWIYSNDKKEIASKEKREKKAQNFLKKEFSEFPQMHNLIEAYEKKNDPESKFVYALDKIQPILNIYRDNGRTWQELGITMDTLIKKKKDKVKVSPEVEYYFNELITLLEENEEELFGENNSTGT